VNFGFKFPKSVIRKSVTPYEHTFMYSKHDIHCHSLKAEEYSLQADIHLTSEDIAYFYEIQFL
jgi:hypothetical protein